MCLFNRCVVWQVLALEEDLQAAASVMVNLLVKYASLAAQYLPN